MEWNKVHFNGPMRRRMLTLEASRWVNMHESDTEDNGGQFVKRVQGAVVKRAHDEPWCMDFIHFCADAVDDIVTDLSKWFQRDERCCFILSESCMKVFKQYVKDGFKVYKEPKEGLVVIWDRGGGSGHCGIVDEVHENGTVFHTIEGNTSNPHDFNAPEGVYRKIRDYETPPAKSWKLMGFIDPWADSNAAEK